jgi:hypothetical protein
MTVAPNPFAIAADLLFPPEHPYRHDPAGYVRDVLGEELWSGQVEMVENVVHHDNTVVMAAHSVGKTRALSRLVLWWVGVRCIWAGPGGGGRASLRKLGGCADVEPPVPTSIGRRLPGSGSHRR